MCVLLRAAHPRIPGTQCRANGSKTSSAARQCSGLAWIGFLNTSVPERLSESFAGGWIGWVEPLKDCANFLMNSPSEVSILCRSAMDSAWPHLLGDFMLAYWPVCANTRMKSAQSESVRAKILHAGKEIRWGGSKKGWRWKVTDDQVAAIPLGPWPIFLVRDRLGSWTAGGHVVCALQRCRPCLEATTSATEY